MIFLTVLDESSVTPSAGVAPLRANLLNTARVPDESGRFTRTIF